MSQASSEIAAISQMGLPIGSVIAGKYRVDGILGSGGMGVVLSATNLDLDAPVAIKVVREELANNDEVVSRMVQEARCAARMHGAHMVRVLDVARLDTGAPYIVMEHLEGRDLATLLSERGALPIQEAVGYVLQACEGLAEAHALGIIHRDLKPENLFLATTPDGIVLKILDFGISKDLGNSGRPGPRVALTNAGCAVGSPYYMAPEQMRASPDVDGRADIWSLGAVLFELLTGKCPFEGESVQVVCVNVLNVATPSLRSFSNDAPEELEAIVQRCLEKAPEARFQTATALATALRDFVSAESQRLADRRLASGISLVPKPLAEPPSLGLGSSPTLESPSYVGNASITRRDSELRDVDAMYPKPPRRALRFAAAAAFVLGLAGAAFTLWQRHGAAGAASSLAAHPSMPALAPARIDEPAHAPVVIAAAVAPKSKEAEPAREPVLATHDAEQALPATPTRRHLTRVASAPLPAPKVGATPAPARTTAPPPVASAAFDDLQSSPASGQRPSVNAWNVDSLGGRY